MPEQETRQARYDDAARKLRSDRRYTKEHYDKARLSGGYNGDTYLKTARDGGDSVVVKQAKSRSAHADLEREAVFSQLAHDVDAAHSRVAQPRAVLERKGKHRGTNKVVLELQAGGDAKKAVDAMTFSMQQGDITGEAYANALAYLVHEIARGLEQIHQAGLAHNDLKLENVFLDGNMNVKIGDFGAAAWFGEKEIVTDAHFADADTIEAIGCQPSTDVYSLGVIIDKLPPPIGLLQSIAAGAQNEDHRARPTPSAIAATLAAHDADGARATLSSCHDAAKARQEDARAGQQDDDFEYGNADSHDERPRYTNADPDTQYKNV